MQNYNGLRSVTWPESAGELRLRPSSDGRDSSSPHRRRLGESNCERAHGATIAISLLEEPLPRQRLPSPCRGYHHPDPKSAAGRRLPFLLLLAKNWLKAQDR